jgi:hypothetical protein
MAWSVRKGLFYIADEQGIFELILGGDCTFLARPAFPSDGSVDNAKAIAFVNLGGVSKLLVGHRNAGLLMEINPETGDVLGEVALTYPVGGGEPVDQFNGLLGMEQHPLTGVLYGIRKTSDNFARELVRINPVTGATTLIGNLGMHIAGMTFLPATPPASFVITSITRSGNDTVLSWLGGTPPYQIQATDTLSPAAWANVGAPTNGNTATVPATGSSRFFRVVGQGMQAATVATSPQGMSESAARTGKVRASRVRAKR